MVSPLDDPRASSEAKIARLQQTANGRLYLEIIRREFLIDRVVGGIVRDFNADWREFGVSLGAQIESGIGGIQQRGLHVTASNFPSVASTVDRVSASVAAGINGMHGAVRESLVQLGSSEAAFLRDATREILPVDLTVHGVPENRIRNITTRRPFQTKLLREWFSDETERARVGIRREIRDGLINGRSIENIRRRIQGSPSIPGTLATSRRTIEAGIRTAATHVATATRSEWAQENADIVDREQYIAVLDFKTTVQCRGLDGRTYEIGKGPFPPIHVNCRSSRLPVFKSWRSMGIDLDEAPSGTRESLNGSVPETITSEEWLRGQSRRQQVSTLGATRHKLWERGVPLRRMIGRDYDLLPVSVLQERFAELLP